MSPCNTFENERVSKADLFMLQASQMYEKGLENDLDPKAVKLAAFINGQIMKDQL
ncbi:MAG: hypothetical protein WCT49_03690 [Candidatus Paceibacterota bacterium]|jgi:hypothetical protein|nr:hypothetical protein [Candidatus Paceibacterota bacterium]